MAFMNKIIVIYLMFMFFICHSQEESSHASKKYKMMVFSFSLGELEWAKKIERACTNLGWDCDIYFKDQYDPSLLSMDCHRCPAVLDTNQSFDHDFTISLRNEQIHSFKTPNYLAVTTRSPHQFSLPSSEDSPFFDFDGYLIAAPVFDALKRSVESKGKRFRGISWYPSCYKTEFIPPIFKDLFSWTIWTDTRLEKKEFLKLFSLLDKEGFLNVYGLHSIWSFIPQSYKGLIPHDGESILKAIKDSGIALILHSKSHFETRAPSSRVFEALASGSIIITDRHPFMLKNFGDTVLYLDDVLNADDLFLQIKGHLDWIKAHPLEAEKMARKAHIIFTEKFTLENQLQNLAKLHESLIVEGPRS